MTELCSFLELANYHKQFVEGFSRRAGLLTKLLKKDHQWSWTLECRATFEGFKKAMMEGPIFEITDVTKPFEVEIDASNFALGDILLQEDHPITYESRKLNDAGSKFATSENKMLAIVHCLWA